MINGQLLLTRLFQDIGGMVFFHFPHGIILSAFFLFKRCDFRLFTETHPGKDRWEIHFGITCAFV